MEIFTEPLDSKTRDTDSVSSDLNYADEEDDPFINSLWGIHKTLDALRGNMHKRTIDTETMGDDVPDIEETILPPTYIVIQLTPDIPENTLTWLVDKIKGKKRNGGGELIVMKQSCNPDDGLILHLSASKIKFLEAAEEMELMKEDRNGNIREFTVASLEDFLPEDKHVDDLFTTADKQTIVRYELENIRALAEDDHIPGYPTYSLYVGQSIFQVCQKWDIITKSYSLHEEETLKKLGKKWYMSLFLKQPIEEIRLYFGESVALYFTFLGCYTYALAVPVFLGFLQMLISRETVPFFCIFNVVWVTLVLELWKRNSNELAFKWGTIGMTSMDEPRPNFRGVMGIDAITGKVKPQSPRYLTYTKMYAVSIPIVIICMVLAFVLMLISFWAEDYFKKNEEYIDYVMFPSIIYSIVVAIVNAYYRKLATFLTEWENHRTQSQYERHRVTKLVLFEFVNNFLSLFYIAFIVRDMDMLRSQLQTMLIITQAINNFQETVQPLAIKYYATKVQNWRLRIFDKKLDVKKPKIFKENMSKENSILSDLKIPQIQKDDPRVKQAIEEGEMEAYEGTYDDYLELFIQFGYVFLFSSVYPIAALWAVLNNVVEIRADAFKLCKVFQRPMSRKLKDIGAWQRAFEVLGALSILTNCGLLYLSPQMRRRAPNLGEVEWILLFVFLEHLLLGIRYLLHISISDKPEWVRVALAKKNYESKQALKFEVKIKADNAENICQTTTFLASTTKDLELHPTDIHFLQLLHKMRMTYLRNNRKSNTVLVLRSKRSQKNKRMLTRKFKTIDGYHAD